MQKKSRVCSSFAFVVGTFLLSASLIFTARLAHAELGTESIAIENQVHSEFQNARLPSEIAADDQDAILKKYAYLDPQHWVPTDLLKTAVLYFDANTKKFSNRHFITVVDYRPRSDAYRLFVVNLGDGSVERWHTSHGNGSIDGDVAQAVKFGNVPESNRSSLGFVRTAEIYYGSLGRSLRIDGLSDSDNNLRTRNIVVHGSDDMHEANVIQGLSGGCLMLDPAKRDHVIDEIKDGSLMYLGISAP